MTTETRELIDAAKTTLITKPKATKANNKAIEVVDPAIANQLFARLSELQDMIKILEAEEKEIKDIIRDAIGNGDELTIHGAKVASIARWREVSLITDSVKSTFPLSEYPELYKATDKSRLTIH